MTYQAYEGLHVTLFGKKGAELWVRHAYNIPQGVGCWQPYRVLVQSHGCMAYTAFYTFAAFKRWLGGMRVQLSPHQPTIGKRAWVARFGTIKKAA